DPLCETPVGQWQISRPPVMLGRMAHSSGTGFREGCKDVSHAISNRIQSNSATCCRADACAGRLVEAERSASGLSCDAGKACHLGTLQRGQQRRNARRAEGGEALAALLAQRLYRQCRVGADAVDRKQHQVRSAGQTGKKGQVTFDTAIMMQECSADPLNDRAEMGDLMR